MSADWTAVGRGGVRILVRPRVRDRTNDDEARRRGRWVADSAGRALLSLLPGRFPTPEIVVADNKSRPGLGRATAATHLRRSSRPAYSGPISARRTARCDRLTSGPVRAVRAWQSRQARVAPMLVVTELALKLQRGCLSHRSSPESGKASDPYNTECLGKFTGVG